MGLLDFFHDSSLQTTAQKMGYLSDQEGIMSRYLREKAGWDEHLHYSKQCILDAVAFHKATTVTILGSGWLLDVPLHELSIQCEKVYLYDVFHPPLIRQKVKKHPNVVLVEADITGGSIQSTWQLCETYKNLGAIPNLSECVGKGFTPSHDSGLIVSLNILNQLDILVCDYVQQVARYSDDEITTFRKALQQSHLDTITQYPCCLISDCEEIIVDIADNTTQVKLLVLVPFPIAQHNSNWVWKFDASGMYYPHKKVSFAVRASY